MFDDYSGVHRPRIQLLPPVVGKFVQCEDEYPSCHGSDKPPSGEYLIHA